MAEEISYYSDQSGVRVSDKRVIIGNTTYSMANITSVTTEVEVPGVLLYYLIMVVGALLLIGVFAHKSAGAAIFGGVVAAVGYFGKRGAKPTWHLRISSASGETTPLKSNDGRWISNIARAINEAIIHRA
jgi:hypothetical protein